MRNLPRRRQVVGALRKGGEVKQQIAIDPGASGGISWFDHDGNPHCQSMPETEADILTLIGSLTSYWRTAYVEEVGGYVGGSGQPGSAMFKFGRNFGFLLGCLMSRGFRIVLVKPQKWQSALGLGTTKESGGKAQWKRKLKARAQELFPTCDVTLKTADALLILEYSTKQ